MSNYVGIPTDQLDDFPDAVPAIIAGEKHWVVKQTQVEAIENLHKILGKKRVEIQQLKQQLKDELRNQAILTEKGLEWMHKYQRLEQQMRWIPVKEHYPTDSGWAVLRTPTGHGYSYICGLLDYHHHWPAEVTHYMKLAAGWCTPENRCGKPSCPICAAIANNEAHKVKAEDTPA